MIVEIKIERIAGFMCASIQTAVAVEVDLQGHVGAVREGVVPASQNIAGCDGNRIGQRPGRSVKYPLQRYGLTFAGLQQIPLDGHGTPRGEVPIGTKALMEHM